MNYVFFLIINILLIILYNYFYGDPCDKCDKETVIVYYNNDKYDITEFLDHHPGGRKILEKYNECEIEDKMKQIGHSNHAYNILEKYKL